MIDLFVKNQALTGGQQAVLFTGLRLHHQLQVAAE